MSKIICLMGATATGKSDLAIELTHLFPVEIISVDSAMVYRGLDIGTAKPDKAILEKIPHHLIDICDPNEMYSAGQFCKEAVDAIKTIEKQQRIPLLVGGTMLYSRTLQQGLSPLPTACENIRRRLNSEAHRHGWQALHKKLAQIDPVTAQRLSIHDAQRIQRALEVYELTGIPLSQWHTQRTTYLDNYNIINIGLMPASLSGREKLKTRIATRFYHMLEKGFIQEVEALQAYKEMPALRSVGYRQICEYLAGDYDKNTMIQKAIAATCQLAKRQMTWLRGFPHTTLFDSESPTMAEEVSHFLAQKL